MIEATQQISAVRRTVGARVLDAGEARVATISRTYDATVEDVWDACTNPERIPRWFLPVSGDLRLHGRYQLEGNAGGVIESCDPPKGFTATWEFGGSVSWIEVRLAAEPDGTRFTLEHVSHVDEEIWEQFGPGAVGVGWDLGLLGLTLHLSSGSPDTVVDPQEVAAWTTSEEGRLFVSLSSREWCEASIAAGTDEAAARAGEARTTAFYTTPPEPPAEPAAS
ncbi:SRPBCC family protein [Streptosporangium carneum]|uniref:Activator of HSP90 ATPase n=1 Tax=Streptosporangium carneum TaxID=47481 RepID=A0A9W6IC92_9ACTN|nr:SRPBCC family protein [Streptosporangium carneum]GLK15044.1 activator of HSP90 ATPase [Streptosporangium carneum]